jgi:hypothetical protein
VQVRTLGQGDEEALETFLAAHADSSIHEKPLRDDEHGGRRLDRIHPAAIKRTESKVAETVGRWNESFPQPDRFGQVD